MTVLVSVAKMRLQGSGQKNLDGVNEPHKSTQETESTDITTTTATSWQWPQFLIMTFEVGLMMGHSYKERES